MTALLRIVPARLVLSGLTVALGWLLLKGNRAHAEDGVGQAEPTPAAEGPEPGAPAPAPTPEDRRPPHRRVLPWLTVLAPIVLWAASLPAVDLEDIGRYGLSASLPATWYAALAIVLGGAIRTLFAPRFAGALAAAHVAVAILIVYATVPAVADMPQYAWTYKHIGVTRSIDHVGSASPLVDIYHRWPGFFALAGVFSRVSGLGNPIAYAAWAEPVFSALGAVVVGAIGRTVSGDARVAGLGALFFVLTAWVAQSYFAPQPLAYVLGLTLMLIVLRQLTGPPRRPRRLVRLLGAEPTRATLGWSRRSTLAVVLVLDAVIVFTHQLSPYMVLLGLGTLGVLGVIRPSWLMVPAVVVPAAYLLLHLPYVAERFPLFTSANPGSNWRARTYDTTEPWLVAHAGGLVSAAMGALALLAVGVLLHRRRGAMPLIVLGLALAPAWTVVGLAYGGEASLRVHYFAAPWLAVLVAWGLVALPRSRWKPAAALLALASVTTLFLVAFFGRTALNVMPRDEVQASAYFYEHAEPGSLLALVNPGFPMRISERYTEMRVPGGGDHSPNLMARQNAPLVRAGSVAAVLTTLRQLAGPGAPARRYLVFSRTQERYAAVNRMLTVAESRRLERVVAGSGAFRLWHRTANTRIYQAVAP